MSTLSTRKQNRILYITLATLLILMTALVLITGRANQKETPAESTTPKESATLKQDTETKPEKASDKESTALKIPTPDTSAEKESSTAADDKKDAAKDKTPTAADVTDEQTESVSTSTLPSVLPTFLSPVHDGLVQTGFSMDTPIYSITMQDYRTHNGVDILCAPGTEVYAAADGVITNVWEDPLMGTSVSISHGGDAVTVYQGLASPVADTIRTGENVSAGQVLGCAGDTALIECEEESHVHFSMSVAGTPVNPADYMALSTVSEALED